ncbi:MAG TPA: DUF971 domain-containing protein [Candidatus Methylomirabilis sp.]|nr:DUF971 domain-containing protein [Candidatus Methylomirabilis sp.]
MDPVNSTNPKDIAVSREKREVRVLWQDDHESVYSFDLLRKECPCAICNDQRRTPAPSGGLALLSGPVVRAGDIQATEVKPVGRYAINFVWSDGHDSGIYSYSFLREVCPCPTCRGER